MKGDNIPDTDHVARLCKGSHLDDAGMPTAAAFMLRSTEGSTEIYLSVNWLEHLNLHDRGSEITEIRRIMSIKRKSIGATTILAVLNVGAARDKVREGTADRRAIDFLHEPEELQDSPARVSDPSHSGIYNLPVDDHSAAEQLALAVQQQTYSARSG